MNFLILAPVYLIIWGAILFPLISGIYGLIRWRGNWRLASVVPPLVLITAIMPMLFYPRGWWALVFIPLTMLLSAYSGVVLLLHRKAGAGPPSSHIEQTQSRQT